MYQPAPYCIHHSLHPLKGIDLICNDAFEATLEFLIQLSNPKGAVLGTKSCRILIADDDSFPTNRNHDLLTQGRIEDISGSALMLLGEELYYISSLAVFEGVAANSDRW